MDKKKLPLASKKNQTALKPVSKASASKIMNAKISTNKSQKKKK